MRDFLRALWPLEEVEPLLGELRLMQAGKKPKQQFFSTIEEAEAAALVASVGGYDVYFGVLPRLEERGGGDAVPDVTKVLWADFDAKAFEATRWVMDKERAFSALTSIAPQAQIVVDSGNGYHGYWLLDRLYPFDEAREVMKGFAVLSGADKTYDKARILRVPGTLNHKTDPPKPVRLIRFDLTARKHRLSDFVLYAEAGMPPAQRRVEQLGEMSSGWNPSSEDAPKFGEGGRNNELTKLAGIMYARGMNEDEVLVALEWENSVRCDPPLMEREVEQIARSVGRYHR